MNIEISISTIETSERNDIFAILVTSLYNESGKVMINVAAKTVAPLGIVGVFAIKEITFVTVSPTMTL